MFLATEMFYMNSYVSDYLYLQGFCVLNLNKRADCDTEVQVFFNNLDNKFELQTLSNLNPHLLKRLQQSDVFHGSLHNMDICINAINLTQQPSRCPLGFLQFDGMCYTATNRLIAYEEASSECTVIRGTLVTNRSIAVVELLQELVKFHIHQSIFVAFNSTTSQTDSLIRRGFVCVVPVGAAKFGLYKPIDLPLELIHSIEHDHNKPNLPPISNFAHYLADVFEFDVHFDEENEEPDRVVYRTDIIETPPNNSTYKKTLFNVVLPIEDETVHGFPDEVADFCPKLRPLYRQYTSLDSDVIDSRIFKDDCFSLDVTQRLPQQESKLIGYCAPYYKYCGATIGIFQRPSIPKSLYHSAENTPLCYGFQIHRNLKLKVNETLRYVQITSRLRPIYSFYYEAKTNTDYQLTSRTKSKHVFNLLNPLHMHEMDGFCRKRSIALYKVIDFVEKNTILVTNITLLEEYRKNRNRYEVESILGYCSSLQLYCGATLPINHYAVYHENGNHIDDVYMGAKPSQRLVPEANSIVYKQTLCYGF
ncbi:hypothetical protein M3Y95_00979400 [Aphelenchoides besseyi]|nr:hypothetical protein M3Y95_00979400 [Aphelenchoides besseyi]